MSKPVEYRLPVAGFGTWRIAYEPAQARWRLSFNARARGEQWTPAGDFSLAETAAIAVINRKTGLRMWDGLRFSIPSDADLSNWITDTSDGVQSDAID